MSFTQAHRDLLRSFHPYANISWANVRAEGFRYLVKNGLVEPLEPNGKQKSVWTRYRLSKAGRIARSLLLEIEGINNYHAEHR